MSIHWNSTRLPRVPGYHQQVTNERYRLSSWRSQSRADVQSFPLPDGSALSIVSRQKYSQLKEGIVRMQKSVGALVSGEEQVPDIDTRQLSSLVC